MFNYDPNQSEEEMIQEELEEAERMIRNGCNTRQLMRKQFTFLGQSDIFKLYRKYGMSSGGDQDEGY